MAVVERCAVQAGVLADAAFAVSQSGADLHISRKNPSAPAPLRLTIRASTDFEPLTPMPFDSLVNETGKDLLVKDNHFAQAIRNFEFLAFTEKFLAGSWNFLSYFGRDTLIAIRIMWRVLSRQAKQQIDDDRSLITATELRQPFEHGSTFIKPFRGTAHLAVKALHTK